MFEWEMLVQAMQNQVFIAMCNRVGTEDKMQFAGESFRYGAMGSLKSANILMVRETCTVQYTIFQRKNRAGRRTDHAGFQ